MATWSAAISLKGADGLSVLTGQGPPSASIGVVNQAYIDTQNAVLYQKTSGGWPTTGVLLTGPASTTPGPKGDTGVGTPGSVIYSATGSPPDATGIKGDYFYSSDLFIFFGPKPSATSWSGATQSNLKGPQGQAGVGTPGTDGKTIRSGQAAPTSSTIANVGDFYIQTSTPYTIYGPATAANTFPTPGVSLVGPKGDAGASSSGSSSASTVGASGLTFNDNTVQTTAYPGPIALTTNAPSPGPPCWINGTSLTSTAINMFATGTSNVQNYVPPASNAFYFVGYTVYSNTANNVFIQLYNLTDAAAVWTSPSSIAPGTVGKAGPFAINTYPMTAGKTYVWRVSGNGASYVNVYPLYFMPASAPFCTQVPAVALLTQPTTLSSTQVATKQPGTTNLTQYYQWPTGVYLTYAIFQNFSTATAATFILYNNTTGAALYTSPSVAAGGTTTIGPLGPGIAPLIANNQYIWAVTGSGSATVSINWQIVG